MTTASYSPVAPIKLLLQLEEGGFLGNYLLLLAHDILDHPFMYGGLMERVRERHGDVFVIVDNSTIELGYPIGPINHCKAAEVVRADVVVLPDIIQDYQATRELIEKSIDHYSKQRFHLMKIPQGKDFDELGECIEWMSHIDYFPNANYWAVGRWVTNVMGSRDNVINWISMHASNAQIHLLGMSQDFGDDIRCTRVPNVMGIDSANPLVLGQQRKVLRDKHQHVDREGYFDECNLLSTSIMNVQYVRDQMKGSS